jgi:hypothetical protein
MRWCVACLAIIVLAAPDAGAQKGSEIAGEQPDDEPGSKPEKPSKENPVPDFSKFVPPLKAEGGPLVSPPVSPVPSTGAGATLSMLYGKRERGRTTYELVSGMLLLSGQWSPEKVPRLGLGAEIVALQMSSMHTELPPAIDEWLTFFDLGMLRLHVAFVAFQLESGIVQLAVTPFFRIGLPTDTSRIRDARSIPIRAVLDDRVAVEPYMLIEPGVSLGLTVGPASFYTHQAPVLAPVIGEVFHFFWSMHVGAAVSILGKLLIAVELAGLFRATEDFRDERLAALAICPGIRYVHGSLSYELSSRIGLTPDAHEPYGDFTLAFSVAWSPGKK